MDKTKYSYVVSMLDDRTASHAIDIIQNPPETNAYKALKDRLTKAFSISDSEKDARILNMNGLGDITPSQLVNNMLLLVPDRENPGFLFLEVFLRQLSADV